MDNIQVIAEKFISNRSDKNFKVLYDRLKIGLRNRCYLILGDKDLAEDAFLNCMFKIWQKIDQYDNERGNFSTWCYSIARNEALLIIKERKKYKNKTENEVEVLSNIMQDNSILNISYEGCMFDEEDKTEEIYNKIIEEIKNLPDLYKDIMIDREINNMKYDEIAEKYNIKRRSIATRIRRARNRIKINIFNSNIL